jgi:hypothetical protein
MSVLVDSETPIRFSIPVAPEIRPVPLHYFHQKEHRKSEAQEPNSEAFGTGETMRKHKEQQETVLPKLPTFTP